jgi:hypothetical protein
MDAIRQEIIHLRNNLRNLAHSLLDRLHDIHDAVKDQGKATRESYSAQQAQRKSEPTVVKVIESVVTRKDSADKKQESDYQDLTLFWQRLTFWAVFGYAALTGYQACLTRRVIRDSEESFKKTLCQMQAQTKAMTDTLGESRKQTEIARQQLEATTRPWLSAELLVTGPITFENDGVHVRYAVKSINYGHSPAMNVNFMPKTVNQTHWFGDLKNPMEQQICPEHAPLIRWGETIFQGKDFTERFDIPLGGDEVNRILPQHPDNWVNLQVVGCVEYMTTPVSPDIKRTFFFYDVEQITGTGQAGPVIRGVPVPANQVVFIRNSHIGANAY